MGIRKFLHIVVASSLTFVFLFPFIPVRIEAHIRDRIVIQVGAPSVWSLGQAHYLLSKMHRDNVDLKTKGLTQDDLNPNAINATRIEIIRSLLDIQAQFSQKIGVENQAEMREYRRKLQRREDAQTDLREKEDEIDAVSDELKKMNRNLARKQEDLAQRVAAREAQAKPDPNDATKKLPPPPPDDDEKQLAQDIKVLESKIKSKTDEKAELEKERDALKETANKDVSKPQLSEVSFDGGDKPATLPDFKFLNDYLKKAIGESVSQPRLAATTILDNFIGMQYEIIAKQLTLLRDEVGPERRVIFLELPASIYTVDCNGDDYVAQVQWKVTGYQKASENDQLEVTQEDLPGLPPNYMESIYRTSTTLQANQKKEAVKFRTENKNKSLPVPTISNADECDDTADDPASTNDPIPWHCVTPDIVRALDIIPRQSALNVNEVQATSRQKNFLGILKLLVGFGLKLDYQKQQETYSQFLQQEIFAAGFGKGLNAFGWTFGPLPGRNRVTPGVKTMYAVLVVPRKATSLKMTATGVAYHRKDAPDYETSALNYSPASNQLVFQKQFISLIPSEYTERWRAKEMYYTPAHKGGSITAVLRGDYFSSQTGVLVDGVALTNAISLGNTSISKAGEDNPVNDTGVHGQFELVSSRELVMKFAMNKDYIGTPNITIITPENSSALNFVNMSINGHRINTTLTDLVKGEPMFMPDFKLEPDKFELLPDPSPQFYQARLKGQGLRRKADVWVNGSKLDVFRPYVGRLNLIAQYTPGRSTNASDIDAYRHQLAINYAQQFTPPINLDPRERAQYIERIRRGRERQLQDFNELYATVRQLHINNNQLQLGLRTQRLAALFHLFLPQRAATSLAQQAVINEFFAPYEKPPDEYIEERGTGEYLLRFRKNTSSPETYKIIYKQNSIYGTEEDEFTHKVPVQEQKKYAIMSYAPNAATNTAKLDIRFLSDSANPINRAWIFRDGNLIPVCVQQEDNTGKGYRASFTIPFEDHGTFQAEPEKISITIGKCSQPQCHQGACPTSHAPQKLSTLDIPLPLRPQVTKVEAEIIPGDNEIVLTLLGANLQRVAKVSVLGKAAEILGDTEHGIMVIKLPKEISIAEGVKTQIPLVLETIDGIKASVTATIGKPKTKKE
jgi:hypothetical protein